MYSKQESLKTYWNRRLVFPIICILILLVCLLAGFVILNTQAADQKNLRNSVNTLALVIAEPILLNDRLELLKRIGSVAIRQDLTVTVADKEGKLIAAFPPIFEGEKANRKDSIIEEIIANNGTPLGQISAVRTHPSTVFDSIALFTVLLVTFFGLVIVWIIRTVRPIYYDVLSLTSSKFEGTSSSGEFRFAETQQTFDTLQKQSDELVVREKELLLVEVASEVAHNIRSPVAALDNMMAILPQIPKEDLANIQGSLSSIKDIANSLLTRLRSSPQISSQLGKRFQNPALSEEEKINVLIGHFIEQIVSEKRFEYQEKPSLKIITEIPRPCHFAFAHIQRGPFKVMISNLINNAAEAMGFNGQVHIAMELADARLKVRIRDAGVGISPEVLPKLGAKQVTDKPEGNGLGLLQAFAFAKQLGGNIEIDSAAGKGTTVTVILPISNAPAWFQPSLEIAEGANIVILDDSPGIHKALAARFNTLNQGYSGLNIVAFSKLGDLLEWRDKHAQEWCNALHLFDYDFKDTKYNGLEAIKFLNIGRHAKLVTSYYDDEGLQKRCVEDGIQMVPKHLIGSIPIELRVRAPSQPHAMA